MMVLQLADQVVIIGPNNQTDMGGEADLDIQVACACCVMS
jgi:hypothetical protein